MSRRKRDESNAGSNRFIHAELHGSSGGFDIPTEIGVLKVYIDRYERSFSICDGNRIMTVPLDRVIDLLHKSGET